jgi:hypothetical protein
MKIFKYLDDSGISGVLKNPEELSIRFQLPKSYNDPYELFLQPHPPLDSRELFATYDFFLGSMVQAPCSCFSRRPDSVVMWAHYCDNASGACLVFDEDRLVGEFDAVFVGDVEYSETPAVIDSAYVEWAFETQKNRHAQMLLSVANYAAYFIKRADWSYEQERRMVAPLDAVDELGGMLLAQVSAECLSSIILGPAVSTSTQELCEDRASTLGIPIERINFGRKTFAPLFIRPDGKTSTWSENGFDAVERICGICGEPIDNPDDELCAWCSVTDSERQAAGGYNLMTLSIQLGVMEGIPMDFQGLNPRGRQFEDSCED